MSLTPEDKINQLCSSWVATAQQPTGGFTIGGATEQYRLLRNRIQFHELPYEGIQAACLGLSQVLLLKGVNTFIDLDHKWFWAWAGEVLLSPQSSLFSHSQEEMAINQLFGVCIRASLAGTTAPPQSREDWVQKRKVLELTDFNTQQLTQNTHLILAYLSPTLLEGVLKKVCCQYVDYSGQVIMAFDVTNVDGRIKHYMPNSDPRRGRCSSLRDLLFLLYNNVSDNDLKTRLDGIRQHLSSLDSSVDPFDLLYSWRNETLHGQTSFPTIGGTLLNIVIMILFNQIRTNYDQLRAEIWENTQKDIGISRLAEHRSPWSYYPPY